MAPGILPEVSMADFEPYLSKHSASCNRFIDVREHATWEQSSVGEVIGGPVGGVESETRGQGEGLLACLREIPPLYFDEDFALENGATFHAACPFTTIQANMMLQEKLSHYLDLVEIHLVKEISSRSDSFFEALGELEDLNARIVEACDQIRELQSTVGLLDTDLVDAALTIQQANMRRNNLLALHHKLKLLSYVNHALSTLRLLVASADCAAALDVIDDMRQLLESDELVGLHCFRHLGDQLMQAAESVNSMLMADFVREAIHDTFDLEPSHIMAAFHSRKKLEYMHAKDIVAAEVNRAESLGEEEVKNGLREQLLPIIIGLLRTSKLPAVLRAYRETLITDIKAAIKCVVNELLPVLFTGPVEREDKPDTDGGQSLAYKLKGLTADAFLQLLLGVFVIIQTRLKRAAEVRVVIEQIIGLEDSYAAAAVAAAFVSGAAQAAAAEEAQQEMKGKALSVPAGSELASSAHAVLTATSTPKQFRADVMRENTEAVCAACDAAHGRWTKLLGVRALVHPKLKLHEFVSIYDITNDFISATETVGGRLGYSIRGTLQSQSKSFVDAQHSSRLSSISAHLDQESWVAVDALDDYQAIVDALIADSSFEIVHDGTSNGEELVRKDVNSVTDGDVPTKASTETQPPANGVPETGVGKVIQSQGFPSAVQVDSRESGQEDAKACANGETERENLDNAQEHIREADGEFGKEADRDHAENAEIHNRVETEDGAAVREAGENGSANLTSVVNSTLGDESADERTMDRIESRPSRPADERSQEGSQEGRLDGGRLSETPGDSSQGLGATAVVTTDLERVPESQGNGVSITQTRTSQELDAASTVAPRVATDVQAKPKVAKATVKTLLVRGEIYHVVSSALMMLKMVAEYLDIANALPALATEVVHRIAEILKIFNTRTCQLVLGAGAMQVSGLKSITAKHLALSSQCISLFYALIGDIKRSLSVHIPDARKGLLLMEIDRVGQDYRVHRDEIHSKLVAIMRERLQFHLRSLPVIVEGWNKLDEADQQPSQFARALTKEVGVLHRVLSPLLLESGLRSIFSRVVELFHVQLADSFSKIDTSAPQVKRRLYRDVQCILQCLGTLPGASPVENFKPRELDQLLLLRFGSEPPL